MIGHSTIATFTFRYIALRIMRRLDPTEALRVTSRGDAWLIQRKTSRERS